jgi:hypothetical protein
MAADSYRHGDALDGYELEGRRRLVIGLKTNRDRLANALAQLVPGAGLRVASRKRGDRGYKITVAVPLHDNREFPDHVSLSFAIAV